MKLSDKKAVAVVALSLPLALTASASAGFSNFGPGGAYDGTSGYLVTGVQHHAMAFQTSITGNVVQISLGLVLQSGPFTSAGTVMLHSDDGGVPGATLGTWSAFGMSAPGPNAPPVTINIAGGPLLTAGQMYWLSISLPITSQAQLLWGYNTINDIGPAASRPFGGAWSSDPSEDRGAFSVIVPGPSALPALLMFGAAVGRRRRNS